MTIEITLNYNILSFCTSLKLCMSLDSDTVGTVNYRNKRNHGYPFAVLLQLTQV